MDYPPPSIVYDNYNQAHAQYLADIRHKVIAAIKTSTNYPIRVSFLASETNGYDLDVVCVELRKAGYLTTVLRCRPDGITPITSDDEITYFYCLKITDAGKR